MTELEINNFCRRYNIRAYAINEDMSIDVDGFVDISNCDFVGELPLNFNKVSGKFDCSSNELTTLKGCPKEVGGKFDCFNNILTDLKYCPEVVGGSFHCDDNEITTLEYCPKEVGGFFNCNRNDIPDLIGFDTKFEENIYTKGNPIGEIFHNGTYDFIKAFKIYKVLKGKEVNLKRLKYIMELFDKNIDLEGIKECYDIV